MPRHGLFVGMLTLDLVYLSAQLSGNNQKIVASSYTIAAGGPATNAAVTFSYLGNQSQLLGVVGLRCSYYAKASIFNRIHFKVIQAIASYL